MGLKNFIKNKLEEAKQENQQKKQARQEARKEYLEGYKAQTKKEQYRKGRDQARRDNVGWGQKLGGIANSIGDVSGKIEMDTSAFDFNPPMQAQPRSNARKGKRKKSGYPSLDFTDW